MRAPIGEHVQRVVVPPQRDVDEHRTALVGLHAHAVPALVREPPHEPRTRRRESLNRFDGRNELAHPHVVERREQASDVDLGEVVHHVERRRYPSASRTPPDPTSESVGDVDLALGPLLPHGRP
jgi:hypothetical protein